MRPATLLVLLAAALTAGCTQIQPNWTDIPGTDLAQRNAFRLDTATPPEGLDEEEQQRWDERRKLVRGLVRQELTAKGYRETINDPDFLVRFWGKRGGAYSKFRYSGEQKGTIDIRAMDPETGKWLWHGWASETIVRRLDAEDELRKAVPMILEKFPRSATTLQ